MNFLHDKNALYMVMDVESNGLQGEGFSVAWRLQTGNGSFIKRRAYHCNMELARGVEADKNWVRANVTIPDNSVEMANPIAVRTCFWGDWVEASKEGATLWADCNWPVETNFLTAMIKDNPARASNAPYPFYDIAPVLFAAGLNPLESFPRLENELPIHNPMNDATQSARMLVKALLILRGEL